eukprot:TRINITY_DN62742_c0_g1_i1.p1 TRINITY_DN62742_c0_g1~~TRINITY_DN62742_c0_g1_i1.p1  ORF type:complete len:671 (+),score=148.97 TRINITY_DN62742_c0_g1_i1:64-2013(+)
MLQCVQRIKEARKDVSELVRRTGMMYAQEEMAEWDFVRRQLAFIQSNHRFEILVNAIVFFNVYVIVVEVDQGVACHDVEDGDCISPWLGVANNLLLVVYSAELFMNLYIHRQNFWWISGWNLLDLLICCSGYLELILALFQANAGGGLAMIRMLKLLRVARIIRLLRAFPELYMILAGFASTMNTMLWGFIMVIALLGIWSIIIIQTLTPTGIMGQLEDEWCNKAFSGIFHTMVWFFQTLIAGDSWGTCTLPVIYHPKAGPFFFWIFACVLVCVQLGFMNLILAVIVDASAATREERQEEKMRKKRDARQMAIGDISLMLAKLDTDDSGEISLEELLTGYEVDDNLRHRFEMIGIKKTDLKALHVIFDVNESGGVDFEEFANGLLKFEEEDSRVQALQTHLLLQEMKTSTNKRLAAIESLLQGAAANVSKELPANVAPAHLAERTPFPKLHTPGEVAEQGITPAGKTSDDTSTRRPEAAIDAFTAELQKLVQHVSRQLEHEVTEQIAQLAASAEEGMEKVKDMIDNLPSAMDLQLKLDNSGNPLKRAVVCRVLRSKSRECRDRKFHSPMSNFPESPDQEHSFVDRSESPCSPLLHRKAEVTESRRRREASDLRREAFDDHHRSPDPPVTSISPVASKTSMPMPDPEQLM